MLEKVYMGYIEEIHKSILLGRKAIITRTGEQGTIIRLVRCYDENKKVTGDVVEVQVGNMVGGMRLEDVGIQ